MISQKDVCFMNGKSDFHNLVSKYPQHFKEKINEAARLKEWYKPMVQLGVIVCNMCKFYKWILCMHFCCCMYVSVMCMFSCVSVFEPFSTASYAALYHNSACSFQKLF